MFCYAFESSVYVLGHQGEILALVALCVCFNYVCILHVIFVLNIMVLYTMNMMLDSASTSPICSSMIWDPVCMCRDMEEKLLASI